MGAFALSPPDLVEHTCSHGKKILVSPEQKKKKKLDDDRAFIRFMDFWSCPWKSFTRTDWLSSVATLVAVLGVITALCLAPRNTLGWAALSDISVVADESKTDSHIKVTVNEVSVPSPHIVRLKVGNIGNQPVKAQDYEEYFAGTKGLFFKPAKAAKILSVDIESTDPPDRPSLLVRTIESNGCSYGLLGPVNLNPGESVTLRILTDKDPGKISLHGHIAGTSLENAKDQYELWKKALSIYSSVMGFVYPLCFSLFMSDLFNRIAHKRSVAIIVIIFPIVIGILLAIDFFLQMRAQLVF